MPESVKQPIPSIFCRWWSYHKLWLKEWSIVAFHRQGKAKDHMLSAVCSTIGVLFGFAKGWITKENLPSALLVAVLGYVVVIVITWIWHGLLVSSKISHEQQQKISGLQEDLNSETHFARKASAEFIRQAVDLIKLGQRVRAAEGLIGPKERELAGVYAAPHSCIDKLSSTENASYDMPIWEAVLFIADKIGEIKDSNYFPKTLAYMRQLGANGNLALWGRKQLDSGRFKIRKFSDVITVIPREYWETSKLTAGCVAREYSSTIPCTMPEQPSSWDTEDNSFSDIHVNRAQVNKLT